VNAQNPPADLDPRLLTEAFRRAREHSGAAEIESDSLLSAIIAEARRGARDLYSLVKAAEKARQRGLM
jgi:hypothetical protein